MNCPVCGDKTKVTNSRPHPKGIKRMRECVSCLSRFPTYEAINYAEVQPYLRKQIRKRVIGG